MVVIQNLLILNINLCVYPQIFHFEVYSCIIDKLSHVVRKPAFCICENKDADQLCSNCTADQRLCFRYMDSTIQSLFYLNPKFQVSSHFLCLYSPVCVGPGRKPRRPVFSQRGSNCVYAWHAAINKSSKGIRVFCRCFIAPNSDIMNTVPK